ncbi:hypothetical protein FB595_104137 [Sphingobium sp. AEW010]|nr:hypothetical protein FB595_104137 [Sphingobium sp. AEW010]TWD26461.1 hypothetical protein FB596_104137 [Sphingobium sp. AEW013]TWD27770.1 hypothetical protein FB594_105191 [Sphingobium sp. AEW001]
MRTKDSLEPVTADITLRPIRLGFLVDPRDIVSIRRVMRMATTMWGGIMCPIIPVMKRLPTAWSSNQLSEQPQQISQGYIRFFEPDLLVQTKPGQLNAINLSEEPSWSARESFFNFDDLIRDDHGMAADLNVGTNISYIYHQLFTDEFQFQKRIDPQILHFSKGSTKDTTFFEAAFGYFPADERLGYIEENYRQAFAAKLTPPSFDTWLDLAKGRAGYPLYYTRRGAEIRHAGRSDPSIFIFDPASGTDLIDFWNFRLFTRDVIPVNVHWLEQSRDFILRDIRDNHRLLPTNPNGVMIHTAIHVARSLNMEAVLKRLDLPAAGLPDHSVSVQGWYPAIWREPEEDERISRPGASTMSLKSRQVQLTPSGKDRITLQFPVQAPDFEVNARGNGASFVNVVKVRQYHAGKQIAEALPAATFDCRDSYPVRGSGDQFVSREGYVTFHRYAHDDSYLHLASPKQAILSWLKARDIVAVPSDAGRVAEQVIASVGGLNGSRVFGERTIVHLLDRMARSRTEWHDGSADEYSDKTATVQEWVTVLKSIQKKAYGQWKTLDRLVADGMLQLGLAPRCPHCTQENWYSLDDVGTQLSCARCIKPFPFPQGNPDRKLFKYRVIGPFATPGYARGGYAVALTLQFIEHKLGGMNEFTYATGLELNHGGGKSETDFFGWYGKDRMGKAARDPITIVGECKSFASESFRPKDISRLRELATLLPGSYLVAACLKDELSRAEIEGLRAVAKWGWTQVRPSPLIVLTGIDLFSNGPFSVGWEKAGGARAAYIKANQHIFDFTTLADATQQAILGMSSEDVAAVRYKRSRALALKRARSQREI